MGLWGCAARRRLTSRLSARCTYNNVIHKETIARPPHRAQWTWEEDDELVGMVHREGYRNDDWEGKASRFSSRRSGNALSHRWYLLRAQGLDGVGSARKASKAMPKAKKRHKYK